MKQRPLFIIAALLLAACANPNRQAATEAAQHYLDATANYRIDDARPYATHETLKSLDFMQRVIIPQTDSAYLHDNQPATISIRQIEFPSDTEAIVHYHKSTPIKEKDSRLKMRLRDGQWKAYMVMKQDTTAAAGN